jgi:hypothetical protein
MQLLCEFRDPLTVPSALVAAPLVRSADCDGTVMVALRIAFHDHPVNEHCLENIEHSRFITATYVR